MTEAWNVCKEKKRKVPLSISRLCLGWLGLFCLFLMLRNAETATEYMTRGLRLCAKTVVPSLFPFMVISELIMSSGIGIVLIRPFSPFLKPIFRLPQEGCCAVILGMLCGFPIGARCAMTALKSNQLNKEDALRVLLFSTNPSTAFLINAVGISLWGNRRFGGSLFIAVLLSQLAIGLLLTHTSHSPYNHSYPEEIYSFSMKNISIAKLFTQSIGSACTGTLLICSYVVFFSALSGTVNLVLNRVGASTILKAAVACISELSGGVSAASSLSSPLIAAMLCAFASGWGGISVHCQLLSVCDGQGLRFRTYFTAKLLQGLFCALLIWAWICLDPTLLIPANGC